MFKKARPFRTKLIAKHERAMKKRRFGLRNVPVTEVRERNHRELVWLYAAVNERSISIPIVNICGGQTSKAKNSRSRIIPMMRETWIALCFCVLFSILEEQQKSSSGSVHDPPAPKRYQNQFQTNFKLSQKHCAMEKRKTTQFRMKK
jgi:hypothetical protein